MSYRLLSAIVLIGLAVSLMGCRAGPVPVSAAGDPVSRLDPTGQEVILWHSLSGPAADELAVLVDEFNSVNSWHITVAPQYQGVYPTLRNRLDDALDRGASPDLVALYPYHAAEYVRKGAATPLDAFAASTRFGFSEADRADLYPAFLNSDRDPQLGQWTSFPLERSAIVLYYNADWLMSLGFQDPPLTWPAFKEMCKQATSNPDDHAPLNTFGYVLVPDASIFSALVFSRGGTLVSQDARQVEFNSTQGTQAMNILRDVFNPHQGYIAQGQGWDRLDWARGKALFAIAPSSEMPAFKTAVDQGGLFRWSVAPLPHNTPDPVTLFVGQSWTVFKTTPQRQLAAWLFIRWFTGVSQTQRWAQATSTLPLRNSAAQTIDKQQDLDPNVQVVLSLLPFGRSEPAVASWGQAREVLADTVRAVAGGQAPPAALQQAEAKINPLLR